MKQIPFLFSAVFASIMVSAQSMEQGTQQLFYERYQSAENTFHRILQQDANNVGAWYYLSKDYLSENEPKKAFDSLQLAPASVKTDKWYKVAYGALLLQMNRKDEASGYFNDALNDTKEKDAGILAAVADAHIRSKTGDANIAIDLLNKAVRRDKKEPSLYLLLGNAYLKLSNGSEAFKAYQQAIQVNDKYAPAYQKMAEIFVTQKNPEMYVSYFQKAIAADPNYAPAYYRLYIYEFNRDPAKAMEYYQQYLSKSDASIKNEYDLADLLYLNKQYDMAIQKANSILKTEGKQVEPRLFKLISYSYAAQKDSAKAFDYMQQYFTKQPDSNFVAKDFLLMGSLYASVKMDDSLAFVCFDKAATLEKDSSELIGYYKRFADLAATNKNYSQQAKWLSYYYNASAKTTNIDLFNWALAHYRAEEFSKADSVFGIYISKYPDQSFGYYWQAKSRALQDKDMTQGLAVPAYQRLVEVLEKNPLDANYKKWTVEAYAFLAAYATNTAKDYTQAVNYFGKILLVDPENTDAKKYIDILEKNLDNKGSK